MSSNPHTPLHTAILLVSFLLIMFASYNAALGFLAGFDRNLLELSKYTRRSWFSIALAFVGLIAAFWM